MLRQLRKFTPTQNIVRNQQQAGVNVHHVTPVLTCCFHQCGQIGSAVLVGRNQCMQQPAENGELVIDAVKPHGVVHEFIQCGANTHFPLCWPEAVSDALSALQEVCFVQFNHLVVLRFQHVISLVSDLCSKPAVILEMVFEEDFQCAA